MWMCSCRMEHQDKATCNKCGEALEQEDNSIDITIIEKELDIINKSVDKIARILSKLKKEGRI